MGGTFDHIHRGHRALLQRAFDTSEYVVIGLTSDDFAKSSGKKILHDFAFRKAKLNEYLRGRFPRRKYRITKLDTQFGPAIFTKDIEALILSSETAYSLKLANEKRRELGLPDLKAEVVDMVLADDSDRISSTRIRAGEIDTEGKILRKKTK
jgi:pantetheine-phosphate adenylyltransferase